MKLKEIISEASRKVTPDQQVEAAWERIIHNESTQSDVNLIATSPKYAFEYAKYYIKDRWPKGEPAILNSSWFALEYTINVIKDRWPAAESKIFEDVLYGAVYINSLKIKYPECKELAHQVLQDPVMIQQDILYQNFCKQYFSNNEVLMNKWLRYRKNMKELG